MTWRWQHRRWQHRRQQQRRQQERRQQERRRQQQQQHRRQRWRWRLHPAAVAAIAVSLGSHTAPGSVVDDSPPARLPASSSTLAIIPTWRLPGSLHRFECRCWRNPTRCCRGHSQEIFENLQESDLAALKSGMAAGMKIPAPETPSASRQRHP